jgi:hypothetical protein
VSRRVLIGTFDDEHEVLEATAAARARGWDVLDVYSPHPVHGLDEALGLAPSRLPWVCFAAGAAALALAVWLQVWTSAVDWPLDVGGKPLLSLPAFVPVAFELTILLAGLAVFAATFARSGLFPGRRGQAPVPGITDDRFAIVILEGDAAFSASEARETLRRHGALEVSEAIHEGGDA